MKKLLFLPLLIFITFSNAQTVGELVWHTDFERALKEAETQDRPVLIYFSGSDWCKPCIQLSRNVFATNSFHDFAETELILVKTDFPRLRKNKLSDTQTHHNELLAEKYNPNGVFPLLVIVNKDKEVIKQLSYRYETAEEYINALKHIIHL